MHFFLSFSLSVLVFLSFCLFSLSTPFRGPFSSLASVCFGLLRPSSPELGRRSRSNCPAPFDTIPRLSIRVSSITASPHTAKFKFPDTSPLRCIIYHRLTTSATANFPPVDDAACTQPTPHPPSSCRRFSRHLLMDALSHVCMYDPPLLRRYDLLFILSNACSASMTVSQLPSTQLCYLTISPLSHPVSKCHTFLRHPNTPVTSSASDNDNAITPITRKIRVYL